jgi:hypothetical protein
MDWEEATGPNMGRALFGLILMNSPQPNKFPRAHGPGDQECMGSLASAVETRGAGSGLVAAVQRAPVAAGGGGIGGPGERLVHDALDGARAPPALRTATQTSIDLPRGARRLWGSHDAADVLVAENVTRTDDHGWTDAAGFPDETYSSCSEPTRRAQKKKHFF